MWRKSKAGIDIIYGDGPTFMLSVYYPHPRKSKLLYFLAFLFFFSPSLSSLLMTDDATTLALSMILEVEDEQ